MIKIRDLLAVGFAAAVFAAPSMAWAQGGGGSDTPRPPGSDPSTTVDRLQGIPGPAVGSPGNPTGTPQGQPNLQPPANARLANPSTTPGNASPLGSGTTPGTPGASGTSGTPSPRN